jgi:hypothetical protein
MPEKKTTERAERDKAEGKAPTTQAGEFVREEIHHVREGKHGAKNAKQAIAIGLSKARRAGVKVPRKGKASESSRRKSKGASAEGSKSAKRGATSKRARGRTGGLEKEGRGAASKRSLSRQGKSAAARRTKADRSAAAKKGAATRKRNREKRQEEQAKAQS